MSVQLRVRTEYSFGETYAPVGRCVERLKALGVTAAGIVDSSGTWGHVTWDKACRAAGIQPMFGVQLAVVPDLDTEDRPAMWFLAMSADGLRELYRYSSLAQRQAHRGTARLTYADVYGMSGEVEKFAGMVMDGEVLSRARAVLDLDPGTPLANRRKLSIAREYGLRVVAVSDNAFAYPEDRGTFEMIGRQQKVTPQHLLSDAELVAAIGLPAEGAAERATAAAIAGRAKGVGMPRAELIHIEGDLEGLCRAGIDEREFEAWPKEYEDRLQRELGLIREKKFESYFLMVADMVRYAKRRMLVGPSRGSAAGSLVCYLTHITEIDPIPAKLIFERFIDITRADLPDIDLDFVDSKRHLVIEYLRTKYGASNVAQIGTVTTYQPKSALVAIAKRLNIPPWETNTVKDAIFERSSGDSRANFALLDTLNDTDPGRKLIAKYPAMAIAANIEAHASHSGVHAAGILVCNAPIEHFCTVTASGIAQIDKKQAELLNLLKIDALGLRTLGVLEDTGVEMDWYGMGFDDPAVFELLNAKRFAGIFQFEGPALQSISSQMHIESLNDIGHITALARPGPMISGGARDYLLRRSGAERYTPQHPAIEPYVSETFGVVVYQEQVLQICRELGRMSWEDVTLLRKAMSKSLGKEYFDQFRDKFVAGARESGIPKDPAVEIWEMVNTMGSWAFNLAHSYSYAVLSYWTAWMKAHHLLPFAAAVLRNPPNDTSAFTLLRELSREGVEYVPFDAERSGMSWSVRDGQLLGGFMQLNGIGETKAKAFLTEREANNGRFSPTTLAKLAKLESTFADIFPTERRFGKFYTDPIAHGIRSGSRVTRIEEIAGENEFVYIGRLTKKDLRDSNEPQYVRNRKGKTFSGPTLFLDLHLADDTAKILTRIERFDFERLGRVIWETAPLNTWWLVRGNRKLWGRPDGGFKMIYVDNIRQLEEPTNATA